MFINNKELTSTQEKKPNQTNNDTTEKEQYGKQKGKRYANFFLLIYRLSAS
jgi:hypothetical protein